MRGRASKTFWLFAAWVWLAIIGLAGAVPLPALGFDEPAIPRGREAAGLIRATLATLNDANMTGNYSVLRAVGAPAFQTRFSVDRLEGMFQDMRDKKVDLSVALALDPEIELARFHTGQKVLQFYGVVKTRPSQMQFLFSYQQSGGTWKLYGLALDFEKVSAGASALKPAI